MAPSAQPRDVRVRTSPPILTDERRMSSASGPPQCQMACCCAPPAGASPAEPMRKAVSAYPHHLHVNALPDKSVNGTGADASLLQAEDGAAGAADFDEHIDSAAFEQILEMDDDEEEREFSRSIVYDFFTQADGTFKRMDDNLVKRDLEALSADGHFLKGSSATLGLTKVKDSCEKIQNFGAHKDETGLHEEPDDDVCLENCKKTIRQAKAEFKDAKAALKRFYHDDGST